MRNNREHIEYHLLKRRNSFSEIFSFLREIDKDFPVFLSSKCSLEDLANKFDQHADVVAAVDKNVLVGLIAAYISNSKEELAFVSVLGVNKEYRGIGIGNRLLVELIKVAKKYRSKIKGLHLYTTDSNINAIKLYEKNGFKIVKFDNEKRQNDLHMALYF